MLCNSYYKKYYIFYIYYFRRVIHDWTNRDVRVIAWTVNLPSEKSHFARLFKLTYLTDTFVG